MTRNDFMNKLKSLLQEMPESEREEALQYYNDYFDDAGIDNEQEVLESLGSPEQVAASIKDDIMGMNDGEFTEKGFKNFNENMNEVSVVSLDKKSKYNNTGSDNSDNNNKRFDKNAEAKNKEDNTVLIIVLCILLSPLIISAFSVILSAVAGVIGVLIGIVAVLISCAVVFVVTSIVCLILGFMTMSKSIIAGILLVGVTFVLLALGLLGIWLMVETIYLIKLFVPYAIGGVKRFWNWLTGLFKKGEKA